MYTDRAKRHEDIIPPGELSKWSPWVIGVGAIGRQVALQLASIGVPGLNLVDDDSVEEVNLAPQGYRPDQLGALKVEATAADCRRLRADENPPFRTHTFPVRYRRALIASPSVVFCCIDSISGRASIWEMVKGQVVLWVDGRMAAEVCQVWVARGDNSESLQAYKDSLFPQGEAFNAPCTAKATVYCANIAAGLMVGEYTKWLRGVVVDTSVSMNILAMEMERT